MHQSFQHRSKSCPPSAVFGTPRQGVPHVTGYAPNAKVRHDDARLRQAVRNQSAKLESCSSARHLHTSTGGWPACCLLGNEVPTIQGLDSKC